MWQGDFFPGMRAQVRNSEEKDYQANAPVLVRTFVATTPSWCAVMWCLLPCIIAEPTNFVEAYTGC